MEITPHRLVFGNPITGMARHYIVSIGRSEESSRTRYDIAYENEDGLDYLLSLYFERSGGEEIIRLKNRQEVVWTRTLVPGL